MLSLIMFKKYDHEIKDLLKNGNSGGDWKKILLRHQLMIKRIQHERLIHLIVTVFVGICLILFFLATLTTGNFLLAILTIVFLVLFTAYIFHYRFLENTTQFWYTLEDEIKSHE